MTKNINSLLTGIRKKAIKIGIRREIPIFPTRYFLMYLVTDRTKKKESKAEISKVNPRFS